ncbi:unnamed protein product, partial [Chrysoparadoxa australica]
NTDAPELDLEYVAREVTAITQHVGMLVRVEEEEKARLAEREARVKAQKKLEEGRQSSGLEKEEELMRLQQERGELLKEFRDIQRLLRQRPGLLKAPGEGAGKGAGKELRKDAGHEAKAGGWGRRRDERGREKSRNKEPGRSSERVERAFSRASPRPTSRRRRTPEERQRRADAAVKIQKAVRGWDACGKVEVLQELHAARRVSRGDRQPREERIKSARLSRNRLRDKQQAGATTIQCSWRQHLARHEASKRSSDRRDMRVKLNQRRR